MKRFAAAFGVFALAAAALVFLAGPALVDTPAVRAEIQQRLARALQGQVAWDSLGLALLPAPHGELKRLRVEIPGKLEASAEQVDVYLRLRPLLLGRAEIASFSVSRPSIRIEGAGGGEKQELDVLEAYRAVIQALRELAPETTLSIQDATFEPGGLRDLDVDLRTGTSGMDLKLAVAGARWKRLLAEGRIEYPDLSARMGVEVDGLRAELRTDARTTVEAEVVDADLAAMLALAKDKVPPLDVTGKISAKARVNPGKPWRVDVSLLKSDAAVKLAQLPDAVRVSAGSVRAGPDAIQIEKVAVALMDARAVVSGSVAPALELQLADGVVGEKLVRWALEQGGVPERFEPRTPLRFAAKRIAWAPDRPLEADARVEFDGGPALGLAFAWRPERLEVRRLAIKDAQSDAVLGVTVAGDLVKASFSGTLHGRSIPAMLRQPFPAASGEATGELRATIDRKRPERTAAEGKLRIAALDLSWLAGKKALIERAEFVGEGTGGRITGARFGWDEQFFDLRGEARRTPSGPVIDARIESAGVDALRLLPPTDPNAPRKKSSALWPLPVSGRVEVRTGFVQYKEYRIEPFDGILLLEPRRARLEVKEARMCGVSFPMELQAEPESSSAAVHVTIKAQPLEKTVPCLTGGSVELTGNADLVAELRTQGRRPHLLRDMTGTAHAELRKGQVKKLALLGNILSFRGIASPDKMKDDGFPYRSITAKGRFEGGQFLVEESFFDSDAVRLAAHGRVDMLGADSQLTVLVGLLTNVDRVAGAIPIIGDIFGGSMTALPVSVKGDIRDPAVVPLGPRAVTDQLLGIFERTLKLPGKLVVPREKP